MSDVSLKPLSEFRVFDMRSLSDVSLMNRIPPLSLFKSISFIAALVFIVIACSHAVIGKSTPSETSALPLITADGTCTGTNPTIKKCTVSFYIQPYKGAKILNDTETLPIKFSQIDKTMALATVWINDVPSDEEKRALKVLQPSNDGVRGLDVLWRETPVVDFPLVALDAPTQKHRFVRRILTGKQPKSALFISETQVVLPLLNDNHIEVVDIHTGSVTRLTLPPKYAKKGGFVESVRVPPLAEFWVSQMMASAVHRFDTATLQYKDSIDLKGKWTKVLAYDSARNTVYASNWTSSDISVIPLTTLKEEHRIKMNGVPRGMAFSKDGEYMVAAIFGGKNDSDSSGRAVKIDLAKEKILQTIIPGGAQRHVVRLKEGENRFAVSDMARSRVFFIDDYKKSDEIKVYNNPNTIVESPDGKFLYVSCRGRNNPKSYLLKGFDFGRLLVIDLITHQIVESIEAGNQPTGLDVSPSGRYVALTDFLDHAIRVYERVL